MGHPANLHSVTSGALLLLKSKAPLLAKDARNGAPGRGWSGSTTGRGGKTKVAAALAEACKRVSKNPHFSQTTREMGHPAYFRIESIVPALAKGARTGHPPYGSAGQTRRSYVPCIPNAV